MGVNVTAHATIQYGTNVQLQLQQKGSKLRDTVSIGSYTGKSAVPVEQIGSIEAKVRAGRGSPVVFTDSPETRRWVDPVDFDTDAEIIDNADKLRMLIDPTSSYVTNAVYALGRKMDDVIIAAATATAKIGENAGGTEAFNTGTCQVGGSVGGTNSGLNVPKLRAAKRILQENFVDLDQEQPTLVITARQHDDLLNEIQIVSSDFNPQPVLVDGSVTRFMGFNIKVCQRLAFSTTRRVLAYVKSGIHLGMWNDIRTEVNQRPDLVGNPMQVYAQGTFGATRIEQGKVIEILCYES